MKSHTRTKLSDLSWVTPVPHLADTAMPLLPYNASKPLVKEYIKWLATSQWEYHLDDSPKDMLGWTMAEKVVMQHNHDVMWNAFDSSDELWGFYAKHHPHLNTEGEE